MVFTCNVKTRCRLWSSSTLEDLLNVLGWLANLTSKKIGTRWHEGAKVNASAVVKEFVAGDLFWPAMCKPKYFDAISFGCVIDGSTLLRLK